MEVRDELNGILVLYKALAGLAMIKKLPVVIHNVTSEI